MLAPIEAESPQAGEARRGLVAESGTEVCCS